MMDLFIDYHKNVLEKKILDIIYKFSIYIKLKINFFSKEIASSKSIIISYEIRKYKYFKYIDILISYEKSNIVDKALKY